MVIVLKSSFSNHRSQVMTTENPLMPGEHFAILKRILITVKIGPWNHFVCSSSRRPNHHTIPTNLEYPHVYISSSRKIPLFDLCLIRMFFSLPWSPFPGRFFSLVRQERPSLISQWDPATLAPPSNNQSRIVDATRSLSALLLHNTTQDLETRKWS